MKTLTELRAELAAINNNELAVLKQFGKGSPWLRQLRLDRLAKEFEIKELESVS